jgi:hypothetical protein
MTSLPFPYSSAQLCYLQNSVVRLFDPAASRRDLPLPAPSSAARRHQPAATPSICAFSSAITSGSLGTWPLPPMLATGPLPVTPAVPASWSQ